MGVKFWAIKNRLLRREASRPPEWLMRRWPALEQLDDNPIFCLECERARRRVIEFDPIRFFLPVAFVVLFLGLVFFLKFFGVIVFAVAVKVIVARLPRRHTHRRLFGIENEQLLRDLVQTPVQAEDLVWGALAQRLSARRVWRLAAQGILGLATALTLMAMAGAPPEILFLFGVMGLEALALFLYRIDSMEIHFLRQMTLAVWTRRAGRRRDYAALLGTSIWVYLLWVLAWMLLSGPAIMLVEFLTFTRGGAGGAGDWSAIAGIALALMALFNLFVHIVYQNENYNVYDMKLLYEDVLRAGVGAELNRNLDWIPVPVEEKASDEVDLLDMRF